jgi:hypothetical protein
LRILVLLDVNGKEYISVRNFETSSDLPNEELSFTQGDSLNQDFRDKGDLFCSICWLAGLTNIEDVDIVYEWLSNKEIIDESN